jgi:hypothetical protein
MKGVILAQTAIRATAVCVNYSEVFASEAGKIYRPRAARDPFLTGPMCACVPNIRNSPPHLRHAGDHKKRDGPNKYPQRAHSRPRAGKCNFGTLSPSTTVVKRRGIVAKCPSLNGCKSAIYNCQALGLALGCSPLAGAEVKLPCEVSDDSPADASQGRHEVLSRLLIQLLAPYRMGGVSREANP